MRFIAGTGAAWAPFKGMSAPSNWPRNRLLLALPSAGLQQIMPELEHIRCEREQVLMDADSSLDHVFLPDSGVVSVVAVYADGSIIEMATIGRECLYGCASCLRCREFLRPLSRPDPGVRSKDVARGIHK
jgi:hypothetical protein